MDCFYEDFYFYCYIYIFRAFQKLFYPWWLQQFRILSSDNNFYSQTQIFGQLWNILNIVYPYDFHIVTNESVSRPW